MERKSCILVIGATGAQGGSVAKHLLKSQMFEVRCLTRNPESENANKLKEAGAEIKEGNLNDKDSIVEALDGCETVFGVTNFWEHTRDEYKQGINLIDAVVEANTKNFILSTQPYSYEISGGMLSVPQCDIKGRLEAYAKSKKPETIFLHMSFYYDNFIKLFPPQKGADGSYFISFPQGDAPLASVSPDDLGGILLPVFQNPKDYYGSTIPAVGEFMTGEEYAFVLSKLTEKKFRYLHIPRKHFANAPTPFAEEMANMFEFYRTYQPYRKAEMEQCRKLYPSLKSFEEHMTEKKEALEAIL